MASAGASTAAPTESRHWVCLTTELRRHQETSYKSDIVVISGLDEDDMEAIAVRFKNIEAPCQLDEEDGRFVLKGPAFNPIDVINVLTEQRDYEIEKNPQQHELPPKPRLDHKFAVIYHLSKPSVRSGADPTTASSGSLNKMCERVPPPRTDMLPTTGEVDEQAKLLEGKMTKVEFALQSSTHTS